MKLNSLLLYVSNLKKSSDFYKNLGFDIINKGDYVDARLNDFDLRLLDENKAHFKQDSNREPKGSGVFVYLNVDDVDKLHKQLIAKGLNPSSSPRDWEWGNREFVIKDPDGYKLIFYKTLNS